MGTISGRDPRDFRSITLSANLYCTLVPQGIALNLIRRSNGSMYGRSHRQAGRLGGNLAGSEMKLFPSAAVIEKTVDSPRTNEQLSVLKGTDRTFRIVHRIIVPRHLKRRDRHIPITEWKEFSRIVSSGLMRSQRKKTSETSEESPCASVMRRASSRRRKKNPARSADHTERMGVLLKHSLKTLTVLDGSDYPLRIMSMAISATFPLANNFFVSILQAAAGRPAGQTFA